MVSLFGIRAHEARAVGVPAGTSIDNTAQVTYTVGTVSATATSNTATVIVAEILDVVVTLQTPSVPVIAGATSQEMLFRVTNTGNGPETFRLQSTSVIGGDDFDPAAASPSIYFDTDASGDLSPGDVPYAPGSNDPVLNADAFVSVLLVNDIPAGAADGNRGFARLSAEARTGVGAPGTSFAGQGVGGTDAVAGASGADSEATGEYLVAGIALAVVQTQTVTDQFGGSRPLPGSTVTYTFVVGATGTGSAANSVFGNDIPAYTTYVPGTLRLDGVALSDAADADAGSFLTTPNARVSVQLGTLTLASGSHTIRFAVTIN
jgi:uncharacterized repeat protein (TIGR01451 family)